MWSSSSLSSRKMPALLNGTPSTNSTPIRHKSHQVTQTSQCLHTWPTRYFRFVSNVVANVELSRPHCLSHTLPLSCCLSACRPKVKPQPRTRTVWKDCFFITNATGWQLRCAYLINHPSALHHLPLCIASLSLTLLHSLTLPSHCLHRTASAPTISSL